MSKVRSITLDSWEPELLKVMTELGNERVNHIFEAVVGDDYTRPVHSSPRLTLSAVCAQCSLNLFCHLTSKYEMSSLSKISVCMINYNPKGTV